MLHLRKAVFSHYFFRKTAKYTSKNKKMLVFLFFSLKNLLFYAEKDYIMPNYKGFLCNVSKYYG